MYRVKVCTYLKWFGGGGDEEKTLGHTATWCSKESYIMLVTLHMVQQTVIFHAGDTYINTTAGDTGIKTTAGDIYINSTAGDTYIKNYCR